MRYKFFPLKAWWFWWEWWWWWLWWWSVRIIEARNC